ncbi:MAG TPA: type IV secretory system conjugative DNA transfer family protein [Actinocatenispora sp.]
MPDEETQQTGDSGLDERLVLFAVLGLAAVFALAYVLGLLLWLSGQLSGLFSGHGWPDSSPGDVPHIMISLPAHPGDPGAGWPAGVRIGPAWLVYVLFVAALTPIPYGLFRLGRLALNWRRRREFRLFRLGFASGNEIRRNLSAGTVIKKGRSVRPSVRGQRRVAPRQVGYFLGRDLRSRQELYASVEDVFIVLAPPRQGKDVHFCAPFTIDAPGACIVTSTRADAFTNTYAMRAAKGEVHVFDPNGLTNWPDRLRWSPIRDCERAETASNRAAAIISGSGVANNAKDQFFVDSAKVVLRCYLHAAAVGQRTVRDILDWTNQQTNPDPARILRKYEAEGRAVPGWAGTLESVMAMAERPRGVVFSFLTQALDCFSDPRVLDACSPGQGEQFDLARFLSGQNTLYVLGKDQKNGSVAPIVTALMEDLFEGTRRIASRKPGSRMDPPLTVELNEAAHIAPMPNLPAYMGDSGGFSIALHVYLQSLSQARAKWGDHEAMIMWDNAAVRIIMGGAGNIEDLEDISRLMGEVRETRTVKPRGLGTQNRRYQAEKRRVLSPDEVRTLKFGTAVIVARAARPVEAVLTPWWKRPDGKRIAAGKSDTEKKVLVYSEEAERQTYLSPQRGAAPATGGMVPQTASSWPQRPPDQP